MRKKRYIEKLELFEREMEFIKSHDMSDEITERALLYSLQVCVDIATDVVAMLTKDMGLAVEDDYTNIAKLEKEGALKKEDSELIRKFNGLRNAIVHKYGRLDLDTIKIGLKKIEGLYGVVVKLINIGEKLNGEM